MGLGIKTKPTGQLLFGTHVLVHSSGTNSEVYQDVCGESNKLKTLQRNLGANKLDWSPLRGSISRLP